MQSEMEMKGVPPPYSDHPPPPNPPVVVAHQPVVVGVPAVGVPAVMVVNQMGPSPTTYVCKSCNAHIVTRMERKPSMRTHLFALLLCLFGCWPCVCVPYCMDSCNNADHYCPNCNAYIGSYIN